MYLQENIFRNLQHLHVRPEMLHLYQGRVCMFHNLVSPELLYQYLNDPGGVVSALNPHTLGGHLLVCAAVQVLVIESHHPYKMTENVVKMFNKDIL